MYVYTYTYAIPVSSIILELKNNLTDISSISLHLLQPAIPMTENLDVLSLLTDAAKIAQWCNENLPSDRMSIENATILTNAERWPLMIDPQLQGIKWIKTREGEALKVVRLGVKG